MHEHAHPSISASQTTIKRSFQAGLILLIVCTGGVSFPAGAQFTPPTPASTPAPTNSTTAPPIQTILQVNPGVGRDEPSAGRTEATPYRTITYALQQARPGTIIQLAPGNYTAETGEVFPIVLTPGVVLRGDEATNGQTVVIRGSGQTRSSTFGAQNITLRTAQDTTISGITVTNPTTRGTGLWIETTNPVVRKNTFRESLREGIFVTGSGIPTVEENIFFKNSASGMTVVRAAGGVIRNNLFQNTGFGIAFGDNAASRVENNRFTENRVGVTLSEAAQPILRRNIFENNIQDGVAIAAFSQALPDLGTGQSPGNNVFQNNGGYAINNSARDNLIVAVGNQLDPKQTAGLVSFRDLGDFTDVPSDYWAQAYIRALAVKNIIRGFPDGTFRPNDPVTRTQFAAIVSKAFVSQQQRNPAVTFQDLTSSFWGYQAIQTAARSGFLSGYPDGRFQPNQRIPRVQVLVSLTSGLNLGNGDPNVLSVYQDAAQIPTYATDKIAAATGKNIVVNYPTLGLLNPNQDATRAEVAAFVYQALVNAGKAEPIASPYAVVPSSNSSPSINPVLTPSPSPSPNLNPSPNPSPNPGF